MSEQDIAQEGALETGTTSDALSAAAMEATDVVEPDEGLTDEGLTDEGVSEVVELETKPEVKDEDQIERTKLGKKVAAALRNQDDINRRFDLLMSKLDSTTKAKEESIDDPDDLLTVSKFDSLLRKREADLQKAQTDYSVNYMIKINSIADEESHDEIFKEMMDHFNTKHTDNPAFDAEKNYLLATRSVLKKRLANPTRKAPLLQEKGSLGVLTNQTSKTKDAALPKLDAAGESYLNYVRRHDGAEKAKKLHGSI